MYQFKWMTTIVIALGLALSGCAGISSDNDDQEFRVKTGQWSGGAETDSFSIVFTVGNDGTNIFVLTYAVPCNGQSMYVMPSKATKIAVIDNTFSGEIEQMSITGRFTDKKHVEGTWQTRAYEAVPYSGNACESAEGTWKGMPD